MAIFWSPSFHYFQSVHKAAKRRYNCISLSSDMVSILTRINRASNVWINLCVVIHHRALNPLCSVCVWWSQGEISKLLCIPVLASFCSMGRQVSPLKKCKYYVWWLCVCVCVHVLLAIKKHSYRRTTCLPPYLLSFFIYTVYIYQQRRIHDLPERTLVRNAYNMNNRK